VFQARDHRGLVAIKSPGTAAPHPQGRSAAKDGKAAILLFREEPRERRGRRLPTAIAGREAGSQTASPGQIRQNKAHGSRAVTASGDHHPSIDRVTRWITGSSRTIRSCLLPEHRLAPLHSPAFKQAKEGYSMRGVYVRRKSIVKDRLRAGLAAHHVDDFTEWLHERRYTEKTIIERIRLLACWTNWALSESYSFATIRGAHTKSLALIRNGHHPRFRGDINKDAVEIAKLFISYLEDRGKLACLPIKTERPLISSPNLQPGRANSMVSPKRHSRHLSSRNPAVC
jgi:hypothetical protein